MMDTTPSRKRDHVELCLTGDVEFTAKSNGFERWEYTHCALPELNLAEIDTTVPFLGKTLSMPLLVTGMTGGYPEAEEINRILAICCEECRIAIGVGSQRQALEDERYRDSYATVRKHAPGVPVIANIGAAEIARWHDASPAQRIVDMVAADALAVHCNPLQEFLQPEGTPEFRGVLAAIERLVRALPVPVIVKEVGAGISAGIAVRLMEAGVPWIDVAGAGGTSWAAVEMLRRDDAIPVSPSFRDWGIPTADALVAVRSAIGNRVGLIASGGIRDGVMIAKSITLGAALAGAARPLLEALKNHGESGLRATLASWKNDLKGVMFLTGAKDVERLKTVSLTRQP
jgi:isopentenyl-diphosphate Delta-isomerase